MANEEGFVYETKIEDHVSGPAREEVSALGKLQDVLGETAKEFAVATSAAMLLARGIEVAIDLAKEAAEAFLDFGLESTKFAIEAAEFKENTIAAYAAVKGTAEEGEETFKELDKMSAAIHLPAKQAHQLARDLMLQGLEDTKLVGAVITSQAALLRTGQVEGAAKLKNIIEKSLASGHFDVGKGLAGGKGGGAASGRALAGLGIHLPELMADLAKRTGHSIAQVQQELKNGKIGVEVGVAAISDAINKGVIGKYAAAKFDIRDFTTDVGNFFTRMVQDVDLKPLEEGLMGVAASLGFVADHKGGVQAVFQTVIDWAGKAIEAGTEFALDMVIAFLKAELAVAPVIHAFQDVYHWIENVIGAIERAGTAIINFEKKIPGLGGAFAAADKFAAQPHHEMTTAEKVLSPIGLGGMLEAFSISTENSAREMGIGLGKNVVAGARQGADAHSPSEEMRDLGKDMSDGLGLGFNTNSISSSVQSAEPAAGGGGGDTHVHVDVGGIHVPAAADAHQIAALLESQIADIFERVSLELGQGAAT